MTAPASHAREIPVWWDLDDVPADWSSCVVTLGVFDGVHRGHARLIDRAVRVGRARGLPTVLVTFDPHPARVLGIPRDTAALSTVQRRAELAAELGVDAVCVLRFTRELAAVPAKEFVERVLVDTLHAAAVVVGANFTFGQRGAGNVDALRRLGIQHGFTTDSVGLLHAVDVPCSSTHVRKCLRRGDVQAAMYALGRPHRIEGTLVGAKLVVPDGIAVPSSGCYAVGLGGGARAELIIDSDGTMRLTASAARACSIDLLERIA